MKLKTTLALSISSRPRSPLLPTTATVSRLISWALRGLRGLDGASAEFKALVNDNETAIDWELSYKDLEGAVQQAHIHFAQRGVNGGITVFLCTNLGNGPTGIQGCPASPATITGTIMAADVSPAIPATEAARTQGINTASSMSCLRDARAGKTYANVHSTTWPAGEVAARSGPLHNTT